MKTRTMSTMAMYGGLAMMSLAGMQNADGFRSFKNKPAKPLYIVPAKRLRDRKKQGFKN